MATRWWADDLEATAASTLPADVHGFVAGGAGDELAAARNRAAFDGFALVPHVLASADRPDCAVDLLGERLAAPVVVAPMGMQRLLHADGELATAAAARAAGVGFTVATGSSVALEEVAEAGGGWFQLYVLRDRAVSDDLVRRAVDAGYRAIVLTVDVPVVGDRPRDHRSRFEAPPQCRNANFEPYAGLSAAHHAYVTALADDLGWADLERVVELAGDVPVLVKGVMRDADAQRAVAHGACGVVVSNHGGRQLGRAPATLDVLPRVLDAVGGAVPVLVDGGIRSAADVAVAVGLGASAVLVGRPVAWALAVGGRQVVEELLADLVADLRRTMTLCGVTSLAALAEVVQPVRSQPRPAP